MGLNLSRGEPIKYYSSDRITQIIGNGLVTLIDEKTGKIFYNLNLKLMMNEVYNSKVLLNLKKV